MPWSSSLKHFLKSIRRHQSPALFLFLCPESPGKEGRRQEYSKQGLRGELKTSVIYPSLGYKLPSPIAAACRSPQEGHCCLLAASCPSSPLALPQFLRSQTATGRSCHRALTSLGCPCKETNWSQASTTTLLTPVPLSMEFVA